MINNNMSKVFTQFACDMLNKQSCCEASVIENGLIKSDTGNVVVRYNTIFNDNIKLGMCCSDLTGTDKWTRVGSPLFDLYEKDKWFIEYSTKRLSEDLILVIEKTISLDALRVDFINTFLTNKQNIHDYLIYDETTNYYVGTINDNYIVDKLDGRIKEYVAQAIINENITYKKACKDYGTI